MASPDEIPMAATSEDAQAKSPLFADAAEHDVPAEFGTIKVAVQGNAKKPAILTYHDIGLNYVTCFQGFFHFSDMKAILEHFCVYHINAPGQDDGAPPLTGQADHHQDRYTYPTLDQLAESVNSVMTFFDLKSMIGLGVGAGANILARFALKYPNKVEGLTMINPDSAHCGWVEWTSQKFNAWNLKSGHLTHFTEDYLLWHMFGRATKDSSKDLMNCYKNYIKAINPVNLALFIESYSSRNSLDLKRPTLDDKEKLHTIRCNCMLVVGEHGPTVDKAQSMNNHMNPAETALVTIPDCGGMVLEEAPAKLAETFRLFLQGLGHVAYLSHSKMVAERTGEDA